MLCELIILFITVVIAYDYLSKKRRNEVVSYLPGPTALPVFGNILIYLGKSPKDTFGLMFSNTVKYGSIYRVWLLNRLTVFCTDPSFIEAVLSSSKLITKNSIYDMLVDWLGTGLLISTGQKWHSRRKVITPTFHFKILEQFVEVFDQQSQELIAQIKDKADGKTAVNIYPYICRMALDIIAETSMGTKINAQRDPSFGYTQSVSEITSIFSERIVNGWQQRSWVFSLTAPLLKRRQTAVIKKLHNFTDNVIQERRSILEKQQASGIQSDLNDDIGRKKKMALLDVLLQSTINGEPLSNADIREEVDTFMFEGHDTTTSGISFTLYLLSRHPEVQKKAFEEIRQIIGDDKTRPVGLHDLNNLRYLECVVKEGLRLYPPVPIIGRRLSEDVVIDGKQIPAGTDLTIAIFVMLKNAKYFENPNEFIPERHDAEKTNEKMNPYVYIPFSAGPRNCIGQKFAILEMKSTICKILRNFELLPLGPEVEPVINLVIKSLNGVNMGLKSRVY